MSNQANYAGTVRNATAALSAANTNRDGTGTLVPVLVAAPNGSRVDRVQFQAASTTSAGMLRLFKTKGRLGAAITAMTAAATTISVTTDKPHGRSNGEKAYVVDAFPEEYNVLGAVITVTGANTFTYQSAVAPTAAAASSFGYYMTTAAAPTSTLWREIPVSVAVPSGTVQAWAAYASSQSDSGYLPLNLGSGWLLQASTHNAEAFTVDCSYANY